MCVPYIHAYVIGSLYLQHTISNNTRITHMASLDDAITTRQNLILLDNVTNYSKPAIDYFHHTFDFQDSNIQQAWALLVKMKKYKLLRLPSCSIEDDDDYTSYLMRLHHCLWRRWSIDFYRLNNVKADPSTINWEKEFDVTVLYGPDLSTATPQRNKDEEGIDAAQYSYISFLEEKWKKDDCASESGSDDNDMEMFNEDEMFNSGSLKSNTSSIFDRASCLKKHPQRQKQLQSLRFNSSVDQRFTDTKGRVYDDQTHLNDVYYADTNFHYLIAPHERPYAYKRKDPYRELQEKVHGRAELNVYC